MSLYIPAFCCSYNGLRHQKIFSCSRWHSQISYGSDVFPCHGVTEDAASCMISIEIRSFLCACYSFPISITNMASSRERNVLVRCIKLYESG
ncbi:hypothetical protein T02_2041 [Trichinella nativa]|uniref:Uncharacterized protein n=1 Tax=Trichinella nativa TaxID=6335 RepID=A0A0V1KKT1_9BILA|nr:hypothetical protein T02_2041 [Trichinella nativa]